MGNVLVMCSGGFESTVLVHLARSRGVFGGGIHFVHAQQGQGHRRSGVICLRQRLHKCGEKNTIFDRHLNLIATQEEGLPCGALPAMIFNAVNLANDIGCDRIWIGGSHGDQLKRRELASYIDGIAKVAAVSGVHVSAPFVELSGKLIAETARELGVPILRRAR